MKKKKGIIYYLRCHIVVALPEKCSHTHLDFLARCSCEERRSEGADKGRHAG